MKFNLNKRMLTVTALFGLAVGVIIYVVAYAATVICPAAGCAAVGGGLTLGATVNADEIIGSAAVDAVDAGGGNDIIYLGAGGDTTPCGDAATDCLGDDFMDGGPGADALGDIGGANEVGNDFLYGGLGNDDLAAGPGDDYVDGGEGDDYLGGFAGNDVLVPGRQDGTGAPTAGDFICDAAPGAYPAGHGCTTAGGNPFTAATGAGDDVFLIFAGDVPSSQAKYLGCGTGNDVFIFIGFSALPATVVPPDGVVGNNDVVVTDPLTGGVYNIGNDGATACTLTN